MTTIIFQKYVSRYAETFTLVEITEGADYSFAEIIPSAKVAKLDKDDYDELLNELRDSENEKTHWSDGDAPFDEEDARAAANLRANEIDDYFDEKDCY